MEDKMGHVFDQFKSSYIFADICNLDLILIHEGEPIEHWLKIMVDPYTRKITILRQGPRFYDCCPSKGANRNRPKPKPQGPASQLGGGPLLLEGKTYSRISRTLGVPRQSRRFTYKKQ